MGANEAVQYKTDADIATARPRLTDYIRSRCKLDVYYPPAKRISRLSFGYGGGLKNGNRFVPSALKENGIAGRSIIERP